MVFPHLMLDSSAWFSTIAGVVVMDALTSQTVVMEVSEPEETILLDNLGKLGVHKFFNSIFRNPKIF